MKKRIAAGMIGGVIGVTGALGVYGGMTVRAAQEEKQAKAYLAETMYWTEVRQLETALTGGNRLGAYHRAMSAAEDAAGAGYGDDAAFFRAISGGIADGAENFDEIAGAVNTYIAEKTVPEGFSLRYESEAVDGGDVVSEPASVSRVRERAAGECADAVTGAGGILHPAAKARNGEAVYTCRNAYAVVELRSGTPLEVGVSLEPGELRLTEAECVGYAEAFLRKYFPPDVVRAAHMISVKPEAAEGTYVLVYRSGEREILLSVRRDSGRVVRVIAR